MKTIRYALRVAIAALFVAASPATAPAQDKSRSEGFFFGGAYEGR